MVGMKSLAMLVNDCVGKKPFDNLMVEGPLQEAGKTAMLTNILAGSFVFLSALHITRLYRLAQCA
jgi:hypothetical protein